MQATIPLLSFSLLIAIVAAAATPCETGEECEQTPHEQALLQVSNVRLKADAAWMSTQGRAVSDTISHRTHGEYGGGAGVWSGMEGLRAASSGPVVRDPSKIYFKVLGHFDTGTHLLSELIVRNLDASQVVVSDPNQEGTVNCTFWKHSYLRLLQQTTPRILEECKEPNIIALAIVRDPLSWLSSIHTKPYDIKNCTVGEDWMLKPCTYPQVRHADLSGKTFSSVAAIWNNWTIDYETVLPQAFNRNLIITYEDMVLHPAATLEKVAKLANVPLPKTLDLVNEQVKGDVKQAGDSRQLATQRIQNRSYLSGYSQQQLADVCPRLNQEAMHRHGYIDCDGVMR
jgi:hypothetical protein